MILGKNELESITFGAVRFGENEGKLACCRFTEKQCEYYKVTDPDFVRKTSAGSCMRFDFSTDAESVSFECLMAQSTSRPYCFIDAYADGVMILHTGEIISEPEKLFQIDFALPAGNHRITIYFPNLSAAYFGDMNLDGATFFEPHKPARRFLVFGDSITQGYDAMYPSLSYPNLISAALDAETVNQAIGGDVFGAGLIDEALPFSPELIIIAYGTNDWAKIPSREKFSGGADAFFRRITEVYPDTKTVFISPIWRTELERVPPELRATPTFEEGRELLESVAGKYKNITVISGEKLVPHECGFYSDGHLHPNDLGFLIYAQKLLPELSKLKNNPPFCKRIPSAKRRKDR